MAAVIISIHRKMGTNTEIKFIRIDLFCKTELSEMAVTVP